MRNPRKSHFLKSLIRQYLRGKVLGGRPGSSGTAYGVIVSWVDGSCNEDSYLSASPWSGTNILL